MFQARNYFGWFSDGSTYPRGEVGWESVCKNFVNIGFEPEYIWAVYGGGSYDGSALVVFYDDDRWQVVEGSHCSCYGLEDQWEPKDADVELHLESIKQGKRIFVAESTYYDWNGSSDAGFDEWLSEAVKQTQLRKAA